MNVQSFISIKWQGKKLSVTKLFNFFVSDHLKRNTVSENLQKTQGFCVADFATLSDERMLRSKISTI